MKRGCALRVNPSGAQSVCIILDGPGGRMAVGMTEQLGTGLDGWDEVSGIAGRQCAQNETFPAGDPVCVEPLTRKADTGRRREDPHGAARRGVRLDGSAPECPPAPTVSHLEIQNMCLHERPTRVRGLKGN